MYSAGISKEMHFDLFQVTIFSILGLNSEKKVLFGICKNLGMSRCFRVEHVVLMKNFKMEDRESNLPFAAY